MADGVSVNIAADTRDFDRAVRSGMVEPVTDAQGALDDYTTAADRSGDKLTGTFKDQQRSTEDLKRDIDTLNRTISEGSAPAYKRAQQAGEEFTHKSTEGMNEVKDSARSNAIEVGASFTGGFDQALGGLQGFAAEFLAGFGPGGLVAGIALAAGIGLVTQAIDGATQSTEAQQQAVADLAGEYLDAGRSGRRSFDAVSESIKAMATAKPEDVIITLQSAFEKAKAAGTDYERVVQAIASGSPSEIRRVRDEVVGLESAHLRSAHAVDRYGNVSRGVVATNLEQVSANKALVDALDKAGSQATDAGRAEKLAARAGLSDLALKGQLLGQLQDGYDEAAGSVDDYLNKEKTTLKVGPYIEAMEKRRKALIKYKDELAEADLSPAAKKFLEGQGAAAAAAMMTGYQTASPKQKAQLNEIWSTAGDESADTYGSALGKKLQGIKPKPPAIATPKVPAPDTTLIDRYLATPAIKRIVIEGVTRSGTRLF